jgi:hypothetical protein
MAYISFPPLAQKSIFPIASLHKHILVNTAVLLLCELKMKI